MILKLMQRLMAQLTPRFYEGEGGAPAGAPPPAAEPPKVDMSRFPAELQDDKAFAEDIAKMLGEEVPKTEEKPAEEKPAEEKPAADPMTETEEDIKDDDELTFENDLEVEGVKFTKDDLKTLPKGMLENLGKLKATIDEIKSKSTALEEFKAEISKDPIIADRLERAKAGRTSEKYNVPAGVTKETGEAITNVLKAKGLDENAINEVLATVKKEVATDMDLYGQTVLNNSLLQAEYNRTVEKTNEEGKAFIKELAKMGEGLTEESVREWCLDPARKGAAKNSGLTYTDLLKLRESLGPEAIFAAIAKAKGLPVVLNTKERDKKLLANDRKKYIELTGAKKVAKAMKDASQGSVKAGSSIADDGATISGEKLNSYDYIMELMSKATDDREIFALQAKLKAMAK